MKPDLEIFESADEVAERAAKIFESLGPTKVLLAGGETPRRAYEQIAALGLDLSDVIFALTDERYVPPDHPMSNQAMVRATGLVDGSHFVTVDTMLAPESAASQYSQEIAKIVPFEVAFLGLGTDGHTASLFSDAPDYLGEAMATTAWSKESGMWRITLTPSALNTSAHIVFIVTGSSKSEVLQRLLDRDDIPAAKIRGMASLTILADRDASA